MQLQMCMYLVFIGISIDFKMMLRGTEGVLDYKPPKTLVTVLTLVSFGGFLANEQPETLLRKANGT